MEGKIVFVDIDGVAYMVEVLQYLGNGEFLCRTMEEHNSHLRDICVLEVEVFTRYGRVCLNESDARGQWQDYLYYNNIKNNGH